MCYFIWFISLSILKVRSSEWSVGLCAYVCGFLIVFFQGQKHEHCLSVCLWYGVSYKAGFKKWHPGLWCHLKSQPREDLLERSLHGCWLSTLPPRLLRGEAHSVATGSSLSKQMRGQDKDWVNRSSPLWREMHCTWA